MVATGETVGLAEWITGDTCLVLQKSGKNFFSKLQLTLIFKTNKALAKRRNFSYWYG